MTESMAVLFRLKNAAGADPWDWKPITPKELITFNINQFLEEIARLNCLNHKGVYKVEGYLINRKLARSIVQEQNAKGRLFEEVYNELHRAKVELNQFKKNKSLRLS